MVSVENIIGTAAIMFPSIQLLDPLTQVNRLRAAQQEVYRFIGTPTQKDITVTETKAYDIGTGFRSDNLQRVLWYSQSEGGSTDPDATFNEETDLESLMIDQFDQYLKLSYSDADHNKATIVYVEVPPAITSDANEWATTYLDIDDEYQDVLIYKLIKMFALFGDCPDIAISNGYEREFEQKFAKAKADWYKRKMRKNKYRHSYTSSW